LAIEQELIELEDKGSSSHSYCVNNLAQLTTDKNTTAYRNLQAYCGKRSAYQIQVLTNLNDPEVTAAIKDYDEFQAEGA
jgi:hypothetical protein